MLGQRNQANTLIEQAKTLNEVRRYDDALRLLHQALSFEPENARALCYVAHVWLNKEEPRTALPFAERAVKAEPENEWAHRLRSSALRKCGRKKESLKAAEEAIRLAPQEPNAWHEIALAQLECRRRKEARQSAEKMRDITPSSHDAHGLLAYIALEEGKYKEAEDHSLEALRLEPNSHWAMNNLGYALLKQGRNKEAIEHFHRSAKLNPSYKLARANLKFSAERHRSLFGFAIALGFLIALIRIWLDTGTIYFYVFGPALILLIIFFIGLWTRHLKSLSPEVRAFLRAEHIRTRNENLNTLAELAASLIIVISGIGTIGLSINLLLARETGEGVSYWLVGLLILVLAVFVYSIKTMVRLKRRKQKQ